MLFGSALNTIMNGTQIKNKNLKKKQSAKWSKTIRFCARKQHFYCISFSVVGAAAAAAAAVTCTYVWMVLVLFFFFVVVRFLFFTFIIHLFFVVVHESAIQKMWIFTI